MMRSENMLEARIQSVLREQAPELLEATEEQGYFTLAASIFKGKLGWVAMVILVVQIIMFAVAIYSAVMFFGAADALTALKWGLPSAVLLIFAVQIKLSLMPWLQTQRVLRALNRVELLLIAKTERK
ncbi:MULTISPECIES: DUF6768 family protein [Halocynthiibacter]|uniref:Uncharacterized protein n=1 Tax=Halocynthiibacter halioticoli TaxID=2986804 RepID=A0AAE3LQW8_9RHOB|nr:MULTISPECIES: DUF6768 family protein [Halocynthiibacter]MCV6823934.1 hypothetical protein [Halocynthiibacter halioticoli]MCW4056935.1 hypothetical protein [Halocynthiibacter sp. SDUM655004]